MKQVNAHLSRRGLLLKRGSIVDATIIAAPSSTKNADGQHLRAAERYRSISSRDDVLRIVGVLGKKMHYGRGDPHDGGEGDDVVPVMPQEHAKGARDAALVLEEFGDFECPYCKRTFPILRSLLSGQEAFLRLVYRHFPSRAAHPHSVMTAEAAEAAAAQGKFWEFHDLIFSRTGELNETLLVDFAERVDLDLPRFNSELETHVHQARVLQDLEMGRSRRVRGTPGFYLNGKLVDTSYGLHHLRDAVRDGLARIKSLPDLSGSVGRLRE